MDSQIRLGKGHDRRFRERGRVRTCDSNGDGNGLQRWFSEAQTWLNRELDFSAQGVDILASWSQGTTVTGINGENKVVPYNIISGTSMSCPHATAAEAYVKFFHPEWTLAAMKSAVMTIAIPMKDSSEQGAEFANGAENQILAYTWKDTNDRGLVYGYGAGHINPTKEVNPGLVYDAGESDYVRFLCEQGHSDKLLKLVTGDQSSRCSKVNKTTVYDLNYPSFSMP